MIPGQEWCENYAVWPHCNGQGGCWMHYAPGRAWCRCRCAWCRLARLVRPLLMRRTRRPQREHEAVFADYAYDWTSLKELREHDLDELQAACDERGIEIDRPYQLRYWAELFQWEENRRTELGFKRKYG